MASPVFANILNTGKIPRHLQDGQGDSTTVFPSNGNVAVPVSYKFVTWQTILPLGLKILNYTMDDGTTVTTLDSVKEVATPQPLESSLKKFSPTDNTKPAETNTVDPKLSPTAAKSE